MAYETLVVVDVVGRPASYSSAAEAAWKTAVREAFLATGLGPWDVRFSVLMEFRMPEARNANEVWDLDNLIKPTLDAMEGVRVAAVAWTNSGRRRPCGSP